MAPYLTLETTLTTDQGSGLTPRPGFHQGGPGLDPVPGQVKNYIPPWARAVSPAWLSCFHKTRPHPQAGSQPFAWKKRGLLVLTSSRYALRAHLRPRIPKLSFLIPFRASTAQFHLVSSKGSETLGLLHLLLSLPFSFHTNQGTGAHSARPGAAQSQKFPVSNRQQSQPGPECRCPLPSVTAGPLNAASPRGVAPRLNLLLNLPSPCTPSPPVLFNAAISLICPLRP